MRLFLSMSLFAAGLVPQLTVPALAAPSPTPVCAQLDLREAAPLPSSCTRVEGADIGRLPVELTVGAGVVRITEWAQADAAGHQVVGFSTDLPGDVVYVVKAGERSFGGTASRWLHPAGGEGPRSHAIDQVTFCTLPLHLDGCPAPIAVE